MRGSWKMKKKSVVQWVASRKIRWPASTYTSIVGLFFAIASLQYVCVCDFFYLFFRIWSRPIWMGGVGNQTQKKKPGTLVKWITMTVLFELKQLGLKNYDHYLFQRTCHHRMSCCCKNFHTNQGEKLSERNNELKAFAFSRDH